MYVRALLNLGDITNSCPGVDNREECKIKDAKLFDLLVSELRPIGTGEGEVEALGLSL